MISIISRVSRNFKDLPKPLYLTLKPPNYSNRTKNKYKFNARRWLLLYNWCGESQETFQRKLQEAIRRQSNNYERHTHSRKQRRNTEWLYTAARQPSCASHKQLVQACETRSPQSFIISPTFIFGVCITKSESRSP